MSIIRLIVSVLIIEPNSIHPVMIDLKSVSNRLMSIIFITITTIQSKKIELDRIGIVDVVDIVDRIKHNVKQI